MHANVVLPVTAYLGFLALIDRRTSRHDCHNERLALMRPVRFSEVNAFVANHFSRQLSVCLA